VGFEDIRAALDRTNGVRIMIIDACRNNPLATRLQMSVGCVADRRHDPRPRADGEDPGHAGCLRDRGR